MIIATIAAITILLSGGAGMFSFDIFKSGAENYVNDPARLKQIEMVIKDADKEVKTFHKKLKKSSKKARNLNANYEVTRAELEEFLAYTDIDRMVYQERLIIQRMKLKKLVSEDEWRGIYEDALKGTSK